MRWTTLRLSPVASAKGLRGEGALILCTHPDYLAANPTIRALDD